MVNSNNKKSSPANGSSVTGKDEKNKVSTADTKKHKEVLPELEITTDTEQSSTDANTNNNNQQPIYIEEPTVPVIIEKSVQTEQSPVEKAQRTAEKVVEKINARIRAEKAAEKTAESSDSELAPITEETVNATKVSINVQVLKEMNITNLINYAQGLGIQGVASLKKQEIIFKILEAQSEQRVEIFGEGILERLPDGFGFLRSPKFSYVPGPDDIYVSPAHIKRFGLRNGDVVQGTLRQPKEGE